MKNADIFDVLIVYSSRVAKSATLSGYKEPTPFPKGTKHSDYHNSYAYLLEECAKQNLTAAFTTSSDIIGAGVCKSYWTFKDNSWRRVKRACTANTIFDKFFPKNSRLQRSRDILFSSPLINSFSNSNLFALFSDKLKTYNALSVYAIPTVNILSGSMEDVHMSIKELQKIIMLSGNHADFSESIMLKDRYGSGGVNIHKIDTDFQKNISKILKMNEDTNFILQPYIEFNDKLKYLSEAANTEIRFIYLGNTIILTYIRSAKKDGFMCNEGTGGVEVLMQDIPSSIKKAAKIIADGLNEKSALFALDFIISNTGTVYLLEGNISPGIDWDKNYPKNEDMNKRLITTIAKELSRRIFLQA